RATGIPVVIDSNLTQTMSGGTASALMSALRFLGLVDQSGRPQDSLRKLVAAYHTDRWKDVFGDLVDRAYAGIIGDLDLTTATRSMLDDRFRKNSKAAGQVLDKAARFYLGALEKMQRPVSPHFKVRKARAMTSRKPSRITDRKSVHPQDGETDSDPNVQHIRLQLLDKPDVTITLPSDFDAADWTFIKPILEAYIARLTGAPSKP
ncbi:MAG TPA: DUF5343 domain-containing protein, partial [Steroidobacteraceae bacterium]|nr:DUF5343 domain-containing protein [Steroidobacteraceae bacterium]